LQVLAPESAPHRRGLEIGKVFDELEQVMVSAPVD